MHLPESAKPPSQSAQGEGTDQPESSGEVRISAVKERLEVGVDTVETGSVRVRKVIHEETHPLSVTLRHEQVEVRRVPINEAVDERSAPRQDGDTLIIPVFEYVPVVKMQLMLKEEVHITRSESRQEVVREVTSKSEQLVVERREGADGEWKPETDKG